MGDTPSDRSPASRRSIAATLTRFQASLLFGIDSADPLTYAGLSLLLGAVALLATYLSARRASKVDPMTVLRE